MSPVDAISGLLALIGAGFFLAGTLGLLRFRTTFLRIHAVTKADNLGLGFIALALALQAGSIWVAGKLLLIWLLALLAGANSGYLIGRRVLRHENKEDRG